MTVDKFRRFISYFRDNGFRFISPTQLKDISSQRETYAMITFDDGYYNNHLCLPVLEVSQHYRIFHMMRSAMRFKPHKTISISSLASCHMSLLIPMVTFLKK